MREMNPGYIHWAWALAKYEGEEKPAVYIHSRAPSLPSSVSKVPISIPLATARHLPCPYLTLTAPLLKYTGPAPCSVNSLELHGSSWCLCLPLFRTPSRGLEVFGDAKIIVARPLSRVKSSLSSSEDGRGRWARGDGCWEVAADRSTACSERCCSSFPFPSSPPDQGG